MRHILNLNDFEAAARLRLPSFLYGFISGTSEDGLAYKHAEQALSALRWEPRIMRDTTKRDPGITVLGQRWSAPFGIAPMGACGVAGFHADLALAHAAAEENIPFILSGASLKRMEDIVAVNKKTWFQLYPSPHEPDNQFLLDRVASCGIGTLVVTVDVAVAGNREDDLRNGYTSPLRPSLRLAYGALARPRWLVGTLLRTLIHDGMPHFENFSAQRVPLISRTLTRSHRRDGLDWKWLQYLRERWPGHLVLKGILAPEDAVIARDIGVDGIIVSSHGGRQQSCVVGPCEMLPATVKAVEKKIEVFCDTAIRRGGDVLKVSALGSSLAFIGRPMLYAAAVGGMPAVRHAIQIVKQELARDMALLGACDVRSLPRLSSS